MVEEVHQSLQTSRVRVLSDQLQKQMKVQSDPPLNFAIKTLSVQSQLQFQLFYILMLLFCHFWLTRTHSYYVESRCLFAQDSLSVLSFQFFDVQPEPTFNYFLIAVDPSPLQLAFLHMIAQIIPTALHQIGNADSAILEQSTRWSPYQVHFLMSHLSCSHLDVFRG